MKPKHRLPVAGLLGSVMLSLALIHYWLADLVAEIADMSHDAAYGYLVALLVLLTARRYCMIRADKDPVTQLIDRWFK